MAPSQQKSSNSHQWSYERLAADYDQVRFSGANGQFLARTDASILRELVRMAGASLVLDAAAGTGRVLDYLEGESINIIGCDLTREMLEFAKGRGGSIQKGLVQADSSRLPFSSGSVDCVITLRFFHLFPTAVRQTFIREFQRVLRPGGHLLCSFTNGWYGGGINWIRQALGRSHNYYLEPGGLRRLFPGWRIRAMRGNYVPFQRFLGLLGARAESVGRWLTARPPLNLVCWERYYLLRSPDPASCESGSRLHV